MAGRRRGCSPVGSTSWAAVMTGWFCIDPALARQTSEPRGQIAKDDWLDRNDSPTVVRLILGVTYGRVTERRVRFPLRPRRISMNIKASRAPQARSQGLVQDLAAGHDVFGVKMRRRYGGRFQYSGRFEACAFWVSSSVEPKSDEEAEVKLGGHS